MNRNIQISAYVKSKLQSGFTVIELLIATVIFSLVLMTVMAGILQLTKMYYQGINQNRTQEAARRVIDEMADSIRFTNGTVYVDSDMMEPTKLQYDGDTLYEDADDEDFTGYFCLGTKRYTYAIDRQLKSSPSTDEDDKEIQHVLWVDEMDGCTNPNPSPGDDIDPLDSAGILNNSIPTVDGTELLSENMRLARLSINDLELPESSSEVYEIRITVIYGDDDLIYYDTANDKVECKRGITGAEYCAISDVSVTVQKRL